jgi:hypothetical protein
MVFEEVPANEYIFLNVVHKPLAVLGPYKQAVQHIVGLFGHFVIGSWGVYFAMLIREVGNDLVVGPVVIVVKAEDVKQITGPLYLGKDLNPYFKHFGPGKEWDNNSVFMHLFGSDC